jgi:hypothetical protein
LLAAKTAMSLDQAIRIRGRFQSLASGIRSMRSKTIQDWTQVCRFRGHLQLSDLSVISDQQSVISSQ